MRSAWTRVLVAAVAVVATGSVAFGLASPDGQVRGSAPVPDAGTGTPTAVVPTPTTPPEPSTSPSDPDDGEVGAARAPAAVAGTWPGRPRGAKASGGDVDWCGAVTTSGAADAERVFGRAAVDAAACAAVSFVFDHRYSRLSLPRAGYSADDFDVVLPALDPSTVTATYRQRVAAFVADPGSKDAGEQLGLVLFTARDTPDGAAHASAGDGYEFYGTAFTTDGYRRRAAWINPTWSSVGISVDRTTSQPRLEATLTASAATPVHAPATDSDAMLTVPTRATFRLRHGGGTTWLVNGWTISRGDEAYAPLSVR